MNFLSLHCTTGLTFAQIDGWNSHDQSDLRNKELSDVFTSAEMRKNGAENITEESTQMTKTEEQRGERNTSERNPTRELVEKVKTVKERRGDGLTSQIETEMEENTERETTTAGSIEGLFVKKSDEGYTPETFLTSSLLQEGTKREIYSVPDTAEYVDTDKEVASKMRENGPSLDPASKTETHNESRRLIRTGGKWKIDHDHDAVIPEEANHNRIDVKVKRSDQIERLKQKMVEEEQEGELVAGISHQEKRRAAQTIKEIGDKEKGAKKSEDIAHAVYKELIEKEDQVLINNIASPLSIFPAQVENATIQIIICSQNKPPASHISPSLPVTPTQIPPDSSHPPTLYTTDSFQSPSVNIHIPNSVSHITDLTESLGGHLKQKEMEVKAGSVIEDVMAKNVLLKPAWKEVQTHRAEDKGEINRVVQPYEGEFILLVQTATTQPNEAKFFTREPNSTSKINAVLSAEVPRLAHKSNTSQSMGKYRNVELMENYTKLTGKQNKASSPQLQLNKSSAKPQLGTAKTPSPRPVKNNKQSKNKTIKKSKEKRRKKNNKTQKPPKKKKEILPPTQFPYFMDNYCPIECACYGR